MEKRVNILESQPLAYKAMSGLESYLKNISLSKTYQNLIKLRSSQINGCAFCLDMHTKAALENGETAHRIIMLSAWKESIVFSPEEKAILEITEYVTRISEHGVPDDVYQKVKAFFSDDVIAEIIMTIVVINGWNRIVVTSGISA